MATAKDVLDAAVRLQMKANQCVEGPHRDRYDRARRVLLERLNQIPVGIPNNIEELADTDRWLPVADAPESATCYVCDNEMHGKHAGICDSCLASQRIDDTRRHASDIDSLKRQLDQRDGELAAAKSAVLHLEQELARQSGGQSQPEASNKAGERNQQLLEIIVRMHAHVREASLAASEAYAE